MKSGMFTWISALGLVFAGASSAQGVVLAIEGGQGSTFQWADPLMPGDTIWFDIAVADPTGVSLQAAQITLSVTAQGSGASAFDDSVSEDVDADPAYWILGNSAGANALDLGSSVYQFGDNPDNGVAEPLVGGDILARFAFTWDGVVDDYDVMIDPSPLNTFAKDDSFVTFSPSFQQTSVTLHVPEPASLSLMVIGGLAMVRRRRR